jgi:PAS domain S-box-containing protein
MEIVRRAGSTHTYSGGSVQKTPKEQHIRDQNRIQSNKDKRTSLERSFFPESYRTQKILDSLAEHLVYHDREMKVLWANRAACQSVNLHREQVAGRHCYEIWAQRTDPCDDCPVGLSIKTGQPQSVEKRTLDGGRYWHIKCVPLLDANGKIETMVELALDISDRKKTEAALKQAKDELGQRVQERTAELLETNAKLNQEIGERRQAEVRLREQNDYSNALLETIPNPVFYKDAGGRYTGCNRAFEEFIGRLRPDIVGKTVYDIGPKKIADKYYEMDSALFKKPGKQHYEWQVKKADGRLRDVVFDKATINDSSGNVIGLVGVISDITERKQSEQALQKSESTLKAILAASPIGICLVRNRILEWTNPAMYRIWGYDVDSLLGQSTRILYSDTKEFERIGDEFFSAIEQHGFGKAETQWVTKKGERIDCYLQGCRLDHLDSSKGTIVAAMDITQRKRAEDLVHRLSHMLIEAQEKERKMIAYELHDSIAQNLSYLKINCDTFFDNHSGMLPELTAKMAKQSQLIAQTIDAVRELSYGLHPPSLDQLGITQTIYLLCDEFSNSTKVDVEFVPTGIEDLTHDPLLEINIYRLIQEGLNNIRKHADANHAKILLIASYPNIILRIQDDGKGFDVKAREADLNETKRLGLRSMAERVDLLQGIIKIKSQPGQGTKIFIKIPFMKGKRNGGSEKANHHYR